MSEKIAAMLKSDDPDILVLGITLYLNQDFDTRQSIKKSVFNGIIGGFKYYRKSIHTPNKTIYIKDGEVVFTYYDALYFHLDTGGLFNIKDYEKVYL